ncbi:hypothetical protein M440DRAFT_175488 [Trichoderma longibrachiatum ATCC 18648]|uniref:Uncharacterized protein n=1 Tax=Trichoderma longibrachiatum ATCC 18648 TaxID=983965 RepID=A0A2T4CEI5_TRILO|nr:hypothetical protein M440DRAFT_175488 [Trichoderma longibrachiatum ATCC 18648]
MKPSDMNAEKDTKHNRSRMIGVFGLDFDRRIRAFGENQGNQARYGLEHSSVSVRGLPSLHLQNFFYSFYFLCFFHDDFFVLFGVGPCSVCWLFFPSYHLFLDFLTIILLLTVVVLSGCTTERILEMLVRVDPPIRFATRMNKGRRVWETGK